MMTDRYNDIVFIGEGGVSASTRRINTLKVPELNGSDAEFLYFLVIVLAVENVPFLRAFENGPLLRVDLLPGREIDFRFLIEQFFQELASLLPNRVGVFDELYLVHLLEDIGDSAGQDVDFVAAESHSTALYLRTSSFFTLRNIS